MIQQGFKVGTYWIQVKSVTTWLSWVHSTTSKIWSHWLNLWSTHIR